MSPLVRVLRLAAPLRRRFAVALALAALALAAGAALMASSGYLISRAALRPEILSLEIVIVGVRFFALARAALRYLERLVSHDAAFRFLARARVDFYRRLEPLVPGALPAALRPGDLLSGFVADVDALQHLLVRVVGPPIAAIAVGAAATLTAVLVVPEAGLALGLSLVAGAVLVPLLAARIARSAGRRRPRERAELAGGTVELLAGLPELVAYGAAADRLARLAEADRRLRRSVVREALAGGAGDGLATALTGVAATAVLAAAIPAVAAGRLDGVMLRHARAAHPRELRGVRALPLAAQHLAARRRRPSGCSRSPTPSRRCAIRQSRARSRAAGSSASSAPGSATATARSSSTAPTSSSAPVAGSRSSARAAPARRRSRTRSSASASWTAAARRSTATTSASTRRTTSAAIVALCGQDAHLFATTIRENVRLARPEATDGEILDALRRAGAGPWLDALADGLDTFVGDEGGLVSGGQRQRIALARALPLRRAHPRPRRADRASRRRDGGRRPRRPARRVERRRPAADHALSAPPRPLRRGAAARGRQARRRVAARPAAAR